MIREATESDIPRIVEMARSFFDASGYAEVMEFDADSAETTIGKIISDVSSVALVAENNNQLIGMAGGLLYPFYFNSNHLTGSELVWWVEPEYRAGTVGIRLIQAMEQWAKNNGAKTFSMGSLESYRRVERIYQKRGYHPSENTFIKRL